MGGGDMADDGVEEEAKVNIRGANASKFYVHVNLNSTVVNLKSIVAQKCDIPVQQQRLIHKGRMMKDDQTLRSYGFTTAAPADSTTTTDAGIQNTNSTSTNAGSNVGQRRGRPAFDFPEIEPYLVRDIVNTAFQVLVNYPESALNDPERVRNIIMNNHQIHDILDHNPELAQVLNDPASLHDIMASARHPELREMMHNRAMNNIESSRERLRNALRQMYEDLEQPILNEMILTEDDSSELGSDPLESLFGAQAGRMGPEITINSPAPNTNPLPNPWASAGTGIRHRNSGAFGDSIGNTTADSAWCLDFPDLGTTMDSMPDVTASNEYMQDPAVPQMMRNMLSNPLYLNQLQDVLESNPQIRDVMRNPEFIRREEAQNDGGTGTSTGLQRLMNLLGELAIGGGMIPASSIPEVLPEEEYATQLLQLQEMGFLDTEENIVALIATEGNVHAAVEHLLGIRG